MDHIILSYCAMLKFEAYALVAFYCFLIMIAT